MNKKKRGDCEQGHFVANEPARGRAPIFRSWDGVVQNEGEDAASCGANGSEQSNDGVTQNVHAARKS